jgi:hypothetical protein
VLVKLSGGRIVEATVKALVDTTEGKRLGHPTRNPKSSLPFLSLRSLGGNNFRAMASNAVDSALHGARVAKWRENRVPVLPGATLTLEGVTHETSRDLLPGA